MFDAVIRILLLWILTLFLLIGESLPPYEIDFEGEKVFTLEKLQKALGVKTKSFFEFWKDDSAYLERELKPTLGESLKSFYASEGFYDASFGIDETNTTLHVTIKENQPIRIRDINISSDYNLKKMIKFKKNQIFVAQKFISIKEAIKKKLLKEGYCSYDLDTKAYVNLEKHRVDLRYLLKKGGVCTFGKVTTSGLETIDDKVVLSRVRAVEGKRFNQELVKETSTALYGLNAFDSVLVDVNRKIYNVIPVDIKFVEKQKPYHTESGVGYDTYVGKRIHAEITRFNFWGEAQKLKFRASWSQKEQEINLNFFKPVFFKLFGYPIDFGAEWGYSNLEFDGFQEEKSYLKGYTEYNNARLKLRAGVVREEIIIFGVDNLKNGQILQQAINEGVFALYYPYVQFSYDGRDSKLNPKNGYYLDAYSEFGLSDEEDNTAYLKMLFEGRLIHTVKNLTLATVGKIGVIDKANALGLPESKYFFGGGSYSNRAYGYRSLGVISSPTEDSIYGASTMLNLSLEADYPIWGDLSGAVFNDNTMLTEKSYDFSGDFIHSAGLGVRYLTPIGPIKLDAGWNINDSSIYGIQLQIGQSF